MPLLDSEHLVQRVEHDLDPAGLYGRGRQSWVITDSMGTKPRTMIDTLTERQIDASIEEEWRRAASNEQFVIYFWFVLSVQITGRSIVCPTACSCQQKTKVCMTVTLWVYLSGNWWIPLTKGHWCEIAVSASSLNTTWWYLSITPNWIVHSSSFGSDQHCFNTLRPRQNGRKFLYIFKCIFLNGNI